jgi:hypothetical protein
MGILAALTLGIVTMALAVIGAAVLGRRPPRPSRRGTSERVLRMQQCAAEDVAAILGQPVAWEAPRWRGYPGEG